MPTPLVTQNPRDLISFLSPRDSHTRKVGSGTAPPFPQCVHAYLCLFRTCKFPFLLLVPFIGPLYFFFSSHFSIGPQSFPGRQEGTCILGGYLGPLLWGYLPPQIPPPGGVGPWALNSLSLYYPSPNHTPITPLFFFLLPIFPFLLVGTFPPRGRGKWGTAGFSRRGVGVYFSLSSPNSSPLPFFYGILSPLPPFFPPPPVPCFFFPKNKFRISVSREIPCLSLPSLA